PDEIQFDPDSELETDITQSILTEKGEEFDPDHDSVREYDVLMLYADAVVDTAPLKRLIDRHIDKEVLAAVAAKHNAGHRLFMGTTNVDTREFIIWDMGRIAASGRNEALELYRKVTLASCSLPVVFGPVYFAVKGEDGNIYHEMHCDGGAYAQVFFRGFNPPDMKKLFNLGRQLARSGYDWKKTPPAIDTDEIFPVD
ncbi:MAG: hypothetical protein J7M40_18495, partial [Planctomycetes bacterium]|nr:hypothetical protein [Planctomycetota bacterium]